MAKGEDGKLDLEAWVEPIAQGPLLGGLNRAAILNLLTLATWEQVEAGQTLMRQGEVGDCAYLILTGELDVIVETPIGEVVMATLGPQQIVGEIAIFSQVPRTATVRARADSALLRLSRAAIGQVLESHPGAALGLLAALGQRVAALNQPLAMLTLAAQALEQSELDIDAMASLFEGPEASGPFAQSLRKLILEMEGKQSRRQEMLVAARLQQSILPRRLDFAAMGAPFAVEALMRPSREIGGDFYDFFFTDMGDKAILVVADVSGKGIPAALFMAVSRTLLRASVLAAPSIETALARANAQLEAENPECLFVTLFLAELDLATGTLRYINAGHCEGYVINASGQVTALATTAPALGLLANPAFNAQSVKLDPGDRFVLISDGVTEAFSVEDEVFGEDRLIDVLAGLAGQAPGVIVARVDETVTAFAEGREQFDDITCLALAHEEA
jgi:serine phosphatase RsbU (regulator of sigma subunit)